MKVIPYGKFVATRPDISSIVQQLSSLSSRVCNLGLAHRQAGRVEAPYALGLTGTADKKLWLIL